MTRKTVARQARSAPTVRFLRFEENGAGEYVGSVDLPEGAVLSNIIAAAGALWAAATSATLIVGDEADDDGFFTGVNLKATDLLAGESISLESAQTRGGKGGAYTTVGTSTHIAPRMYPSGGKISAKVTSVGAGTTGRTTVCVAYFHPDRGVNETVISR